MSKVQWVNQSQFIDAFANAMYRYYAGKAKAANTPEPDNYNDPLQLATYRALLAVVLDSEKATPESLSISPKKFEEWGIEAAMAKVEAAQKRGEQERIRSSAGREHRK